MLAKLAFVMQTLKNIWKIFVMINKDGGGDNFWILWGDIELPPVPPLGNTLPAMAVFGKSAVVSPAFKKQFYKEPQTPFVIENNNKNNRTIEKTIAN